MPTERSVTRSADARWSSTDKSPPFLMNMKRERFTYTVHEVSEYINWIYFFHAWGFPASHAAVADLHDCPSCREQWIASFPPEQQAQAREAIRLFTEAREMLVLLDGRFRTHTLFRLCEANSVEDDLLLDGLRFPLLRQQSALRPDTPCLCLSDFVRPLDGGIKDHVGVFAATVDREMEEFHNGDPYHQLLIQTLADRLAEATTERMHLHVRRHSWGYAPDEQLTVRELQDEKFQGIRPAVGYPSLPDQSVNFLIDELLHLKGIGISLTEHGAMRPHASVSGLMFSHPASRYFAIGRIDRQQLEDYAKRRNLPVEAMKKYLKNID